MENTKKTPRSPKRRWLRICLGIVCFLLLLAVLAAAFVTAKLSKINRDNGGRLYLSEDDLLRQQQEEQAENPSPYETVDPNDVTFDPAETRQDQDDLVNILLIGQDRRPGEGRARSDSMILCSFNKTDGTLAMVSFLRDLYVQIPGYRDNRLNAAYALGGMELLDETLRVNFGVEIDANLEVDFSGFVSIIDILGGVDVELTEAEAEYLNLGNRQPKLTAGLTHMDGELALTYARIRYLDSDFGRTGRQRNVMTAIFQQFRHISLSQALTLVDEIFPLLTTDMTNGEIISYATELLPLLARCELKTAHIPGEDLYSYATIRGMSVLLADLSENRELLWETLLGSPVE